MELLRFPLVRIAVFFVAGIVWAVCDRPDNDALLWTSAVGFVAFCLGYILSMKRDTTIVWFGLASFAMSFCCGAITQTVHTFYNQKGHYIKVVDDRPATMRLIIDSRLKNSRFGARYVALVKSVNQKNVTGKILIHLPGDKRIATGSVLLANGKVVVNQKPLNPAQFDYGKYLDSKSIPAQLYLKNGHYRTVGLRKTIGYYADNFRNTGIETLRQHGFGERELQVLHALVLGQQQEIAADIVKDYQFAGAVHILSVSGLHVGFVLIFINFILSPLPKTRRWQLIRVLTILTSLWAFAVVAGLSPSVVRSATMFSFVAIGQNLRRSTNTFHTLIVSVLLILIVEPSFLFDVGFQLSYAALFFIVWLQPFFIGLWQPKWRVVNYFWEIVTVSLAAQIGTLPLSLYYFHQFPGLFFITNLVVIPLLSIIMALGIAVMLFAATGHVIHLMSNLLETGIRLLNEIIAKIASLEQFVFTDIPFTSALLAAGYLLIVSTAICAKKPSAAKVLTLTASVLIFQSIALGSVWFNKRESEWLVLNVSKKTAIIQRQRNVVTEFGEPTSAGRNFATAHFCALKTAKREGDLFWFGDKKMLILDKPIVPEHLQPDILILSQSPKINLERYLRHSSVPMVVADASNYKQDVARWKATCQKLKIPFHDTREKGFFKLSE